MSIQEAVRQIIAEVYNGIEVGRIDNIVSSDNNSMTVEFYDTNNQKSSHKLYIKHDLTDDVYKVKKAYSGSQTPEDLRKQNRAFTLSSTETPNAVKAAPELLKAVNNDTIRDTFTNKAKNGDIDYNKDINEVVKELKSNSSSTSSTNTSKQATTESTSKAPNLANAAESLNNSNSTTNTTTTPSSNASQSNLASLADNSSNTSMSYTEIANQYSLPTKKSSTQNTNTSTSTSSTSTSSTGASSSSSNSSSSSQSSNPTNPAPTQQQTTQNPSGTSTSTPNPTPSSTGSSTGSSSPTGSGNSGSTNPTNSSNPGSTQQSSTQKPKRPTRKLAAVEAFETKLNSNQTPSIEDLEKAYRNLTDAEQTQVKDKYKDYVGKHDYTKKAKQHNYYKDNKDIWSDSKYEVTESDIKDTNLQLDPETKKAWLKNSLSNPWDSDSDYTDVEKELINDKDITSEDLKDFTKGNDTAKAALKDLYDKSDVSNDSDFRKKYLETLSEKELKEKLADEQFQDRELVKSSFEEAANKRSTAIKNGEKVPELTDYEKAWYNSMTEKDAKEFANSTDIDYKIKKSYFDLTSKDVKEFNNAQKEYIRTNSKGAERRQLNVNNTEAMNKLSLRDRSGVTGANMRTATSLADAVVHPTSRYTASPKGAKNLGSFLLALPAGAGAGSALNYVNEGIHNRVGGTPVRDAAIDTVMNGLITPSIAGGIGGALEGAVAGDRSAKGLAGAFKRGAVAGLPRTLTGTFINTALDAAGLEDSQAHMIGDYLNTTGLGVGAVPAAALTAAAAAQRQAIKADARELVQFEDLPTTIEEARKMDNNRTYYATNRLTGKTTVMNGTDFNNLVKQYGENLDSVYDIYNDVQARALLQRADKVQDILNRRGGPKVNNKYTKNGYASGLGSAYDFGVDVVRGINDWIDYIGGKQNKGINEYTNEEIASMLESRRKDRIKNNLTSLAKAATFGVKDSQGQTVATPEQAREAILNIYNSEQLEEDNTLGKKNAALITNWLMELPGIKEGLEKKQQEQKALEEYKQRIENNFINRTDLEF